jgi:hypothetical protein
MNRHKHAGHMAAYAADAMETDRPWKLWEFKRPCSDEWLGCGHSPSWPIDHEFRRIPKPKTNAQIACELLATAHKALEAHSVEICEPNVDHIQRMVWDAMKLLEQQE